jgi:hypothetical protein
MVTFLGYYYPVTQVIGTQTAYKVILERFKVLLTFFLGTAV